MADIVVAAERLTRWLADFEQRHGPALSTAAAAAVLAVGADGTRCELAVPFPPLRGDSPAAKLLVAHALTPRSVGVLLVRLGGCAAGVFRGAPLEKSKVTVRLVHGRTSRSSARAAGRRAGALARDQGGGLALRPLNERRVGDRVWGVGQ